MVKIGNSTKLAIGYGYNLYKTDDKVYWNKKEIKADASTFERVAGLYGYYKDKNYVYRYSREKGLIPYKDIDVNTLSVFNGFLADKDYIYAKEYRILRNEKVEMLGVFRGYVPGCGLDKTPGSTYYLFKNIDGHWILRMSNDVKIRYIGVELDEKLKADINFENIVYPVDTGITYTATEVLPEYPDGLTKLNEFFKENFKMVEIVQDSFTRLSIDQYKIEERSILVKRLKSYHGRIDKLIECMAEDVISKPENVNLLKEKIYEYTKDVKFMKCQSMGQILKNALEYLTRNYENVNPKGF